MAADRGLRPSVYPTKTAAFGYSERSGAPATEGKDHAEGRDGDHGQHGGRREEASEKTQGEGQQKGLRSGYKPGILSAASHTMLSVKLMYT